MPLPNILGTSTSVTPSTTGGLPNILGDTSPAPKSLTPRETGLPNILQTSAATTTPTYWAGTVNGTSFGPSKLLDVSGKPFLDYRGSTDPATTTDKTRVSTTFDPTATSTMKSSNFYNERMSENDVRCYSRLGRLACAFATVRLQRMAVLVMRCGVDGNEQRTNDVGGTS